jgi:hypothetical protein
MSNYIITDYSKKKAKENNVIIKPSTNPKKKIDVFKDDKKIASIGSINYLDYPNYIKTKGLAYANIRKDLYYKRHKKDTKINGIYAKKILW